MDPADELDSPRPGRRLPETLSHDEIARLLAAPDPRAPPACATARCSSSSTRRGCGVSELVSLGLNDVNLETRVLKARGRNKEERIVPVGAPAAEAVKAYLAVQGGASRPPLETCSSRRAARG